MIHINLKTPVLKLQLEKADIQSFCELVLNQFLNHKIEKLSDCGAVWLYNKLHSKNQTSQNHHKTTIRIRPNATHLLPPNSSTARATQSSTLHYFYST
jgi:hypothetical protein